MFISSIIAIAYNYEILQNPKNFTWSAFLQYTEHNVFLAFALIISIYTIIRTKINRNFNMMICLFISVFMFSIFTEGGKSGQIVFVFSSILLAFLYFRKKLKILFVSISSILLFSFIIYNTSDIVKHRFDFEIKNIKKGTDSSRKILLSETIKLIKANPIFGYGTGSFTDEFAIVNENTKRVINQNHKTPHNNYLYVYFELGLIGFALLLLVFYHQTKELYIKTDGNFLIIFPFMFLVIMFTDSYLYQHNTLMLYLFMSIAVSNYQYKPS
jgi:O-antigen ligase